MTFFNRTARSYDMDYTWSLGSHCFICIIYLIIHTPVALTFSFILAIQIKIFYTEFSQGGCPIDAAFFVAKDGFTIIGKHAFYNCVSLKTIKLPKSIKKIGWDAFNKFLSLETIHLPPSLTTLGDFAIYNCLSLKTTDLPSSLTTLGENTFCNYLSLETTNLSPSLTTLGIWCLR